MFLAMTLLQSWTIHQRVFVGELPSTMSYVFFSLWRLKIIWHQLFYDISVVCNDREAEFSKGPLRDNDREQSRNSIGIHRIAVHLPKRDSCKAFSVITWQTQHISPNFFALRRIRLDFSENKTIHLIPRNDTAFEIEKKKSPKRKFSRLWFSDMTCIPSSQLFRYNAEY